jgi:alkylation response protein AidB-like acyl-CoA dehydrogenase
MNFSLSDDHLMLRDSADSFLRNEIDLSPLLKPEAASRPADYGETWRKMSELGWAGLAIPEAYGGLDLPMVDLTMIISEIGRALAPCPMFGVLAGSWLLSRGGTDEQKTRILPRVATGDWRLAVAVCDASGSAEGPGSDARARTADSGDLVIDGSKSFVVDAAGADWLLVAAEADGGRSWFLVRTDQPGVQVERLVWRDLTRDVCNVRFSGAAAEPLAGSDEDLWPDVRDRLLVVLAAECAGGLRTVLDDTVAYANERVAFGRPIGFFQAIKHSLADMFGQSEGANTAVLYSAWAFEGEPARAGEAAAMAKAFAADAYCDATHRSIQIFGAIGFTWEMKNHLYFKRARANAELLGSPAFHRRRIVDMLTEKRRAA